MVSNVSAPTEHGGSPFPKPKIQQDATWYQSAWLLVSPLALTSSTVSLISPDKKAVMALETPDSVI